MNKVITVLLNLIALSSYGQMVNIIEKPSGYLGKRWSIGFSGSFSASAGLQKASEQVKEEFITLNKDFSLNLQYTVKSNRALSVIIGSGKTSYGTIEDEIGYGSVEVQKEDGQKFILDDIIGSPTVKDRFIGIDYKFFRSDKGAFSPIGSYYNIGLVGHFVAIDQSLMSFRVYNKVSGKHTFKNTYDPIKTVIPEFFVGMGVSKPVLKGKCLLDTGIKFGLMMISKLDDNGSAADFSDYFKSEVSKRLRMREALNFNFGLAYPF